MAQRLRHRGPDGEGVWAEPGVALAHRRLAILDLSEGGHQPMLFDSQVLTYNGEIYNHERLRAELTGTVALHRRHRGAGASTGEARQRLPRPLGRHVRVRRVGYGASSACCSRAIGWGSSPCTTGCCRTALRLPRSSRRCWSWVNRRSTAAPCAIFCFTAIFPRRRPSISGIAKLPAGHTLTWAEGRIRIERYWNPSTAIVARSAGDTVQELDALLRDVVPAHTLSDVPVGVFLSGGIDSALTAYYLRRAANLYLGIRFEEAL